ncbi:MAG: hypothetical protein HUN04_06435 [Desulfobacter sp.]|nr:MAG: hypothetical protein HUN04_06435 [Desulfobacter sp.]
MGRKCGSRRHPGFVYLACIILTGTLVSGCALKATFKSAPSPDQMRLNRHLVDYETQIQDKAFQEAARTNSLMLKLVQSREGERSAAESQEIILLRTGRALLNQILSDQARKADLAARADKTTQLLTTEADAVKALETEIKRLKAAVRSLEQQNNGLEKQLERMKQIDLK